MRQCLTLNERGEYERAYYIVFAPEVAALANVVLVAGSCRVIEQGFKGAKQEVGLDEYEVCKYYDLCRYVTLVLFAHTSLTVVRARAASRKACFRSRRLGPL